VTLTEAQIEAGRSAEGGWTRAQLAKWGVPWPPPKGWRARLTGREFQPAPQFAANEKPHLHRRNRPEDWPNLAIARFAFRKPYAKAKTAC
jgi:hypothetical protein